MILMHSIIPKLSFKILIDQGFFLPPPPSPTLPALFTPIAIAFHPFFGNSVMDMNDWYYNRTDELSSVLSHFVIIIFIIPNLLRFPTYVVYQSVNFCSLQMMMINYILTVPTILLIQLYHVKPYHISLSLLLITRSPVPRESIPAARM